MLGQLLKPNVEELIHAKEWDLLRDAFGELDPSDRAEILESVSLQDSTLAWLTVMRAPQLGAAGMRLLGTTVDDHDESR